MTGRSYVDLTTGHVMHVLGPDDEMNDRTEGWTLPPSRTTLGGAWRIIDTVTGETDWAWGTTLETEAWCARIA